MEADFPNLAQLLGDVGFYATAERHLRAYPLRTRRSRSWAAISTSFLARVHGVRVRTSPTSLG